MIVVVVGKLDRLCDHNHPSLLRLRGNLLPARMEDSSLLHRGRTEGTSTLRNKLYESADYRFEFSFVGT